MASGKKEWQGSHQLGNLECHLLLGGVLVGMGLPFSYSIKDNHNFIQCNMFLVRFWLCVSDEVMVFCLAFVFIGKGNPHLCVYMTYIWYLPYLTTQQGVYTHFFVGGNSFSNWCLFKVIVYFLPW